MSRVVILDKHGNEVRRVIATHDHVQAVIEYSHTVLREPKAHVRLVEGDELPGMPEKIVAERFGDPCEEPCCVPLAEP